jgi:hypothetical protein
MRDEGGLRGLYLHPHLLIPTVLDSTMRPLMSLGLPPVLAGSTVPRNARFDGEQPGGMGSGRIYE